MAAMQTIWSNGMFFATAGCAVITVLLVSVCCAAGLCSCEGSEADDAVSTKAGVSPRQPASLV
jgi:hypothetical protein